MVRYIDPDATNDVTIDGVTFTIGYWPGAKADRVNLALSKLRKFGSIDLATADPEQAFEAIGLNRELCEDAVRFSVRAWSWDGAPPATLDGQALSAKSLDALRLAGILYSLAAECLAFNTISQDEKKTSD